MSQAAFKMHPKVGGSLKFRAAKFCRFYEDAVSILKAAETFINFAAVSMQKNSVTL